MVLVLPSTEIGVRVKVFCCVNWASQRRRCALALVVDVDPFDDHDTAGVLSDPHQIAGWRICVFSARVAQPRTRAASSKSLLVRSPFRLDDETRRAVMSAGNW